MRVYSNIIFQNHTWKVQSVPTLAAPVAQAAHAGHHANAAKSLLPALTLAARAEPIANAARLAPVVPKRAAARTRAAHAARSANVVLHATAASKSVARRARAERHARVGMSRRVEVLPKSINRHLTLKLMHGTME